MNDELITIGRVSADLFRSRDFHKVTMRDIASSLDIPRDGPGRPADGTGRSVPWLHHRVGSKGGLAVLAGWTVWKDFQRDHARADPIASPLTIGEARAMVAAALRHVLTCVAGERVLFRNVLLATVQLQGKGERTPPGIGGEFGEVLRLAAEGTCALFAPWLEGPLAAATRLILPTSAERVRQDAQVLSGLVVRLQDTIGDGDVAVQAEALSAFWYQWSLINRGGPRVDERERAEATLASGGSSHLPRADIAHVMLAACHDLPRSAELFSEAAQESMGYGAWAEAVDCLSRSGLAHLRAGNWPAAERQFTASADLARRRLSGHDPRIARALSNRADVLARSGRPDLALAEIEGVLERRRKHLRDALACGETGRPERRRLRLSERVHAYALCEYGRPDEAADVASRLCHEPLDDARHDPRADLWLCGRALQRSGWAADGLIWLRRAVEADDGVGSGRPYGDLEMVADAVRCHLVLDEPDRAEELMAPVTKEREWYAERISLRATLELLCLSAAVAAAQDRVEPALALLRELRETASREGLPADDPVFDIIGQTTARVLREADRLPGARAELVTVLAAQDRRIRDGRLFRGHPAAALTHLELADCAEEAGDVRTAAAHYRKADAGLHPHHPLALAAALGRIRLAERDDPAAAERLMNALPGEADWPLSPDHDVSEEASRLRLRFGRRR